MHTMFAVVWLLIGGGTSYTAIPFRDMNSCEQARQELVTKEFIDVQSDALCLKGDY